MSDEQWICQCPVEAHGPLGCVRDAEDDESLCVLCQDDIHTDEDEDDIGG